MSKRTRLFSRFLLMLGRYYKENLDVHGHYYVWGDNSSHRLGVGHSNGVPSPTMGLIDEEVVEISSGWYHTLARTAKGAVYIMGTCGECHTTPLKVDFPSPVVKIQAQTSASVVLLRDGSLYGCSRKRHTTQSVCSDRGQDLRRLSVLRRAR